MKTFAICILLFLCLSNPVLACKCGWYKSLKIAQKESLKNSELVFYGELLQSNRISNTYSFLIKEVFKGEVVSDTIYGKIHDSCSKFPEEEGNWIIYAHTKQNGVIDINSCFVSRPENNPTCVSCYDAPSPPKKRWSKEKYEQYLYTYQANQESLSKKDFKEELDRLRNRKPTHNNGYK